MDPDDGLKYNNIIERKHMFKFLMALNPNFDEVCSVLGMKPLPSLWEVHIDVHRQESRRRLMLVVQTITLPRQHKVIHLILMRIRKRKRHQGVNITGSWDTRKLYVWDCMVPPDYKPPGRKITWAAGML